MKCCPFAAKGGFTLHSEISRILPADDNIPENPFWYTLSNNASKANDILYLCKILEYPYAVFKMYFLGSRRWCLKYETKCCSTKIICQSCSSGRLQPCLGVTLISWAGNIQKHTRRRRMITASPFLWFLQHTHSSETCIACNKSLPHYAPSGGLFRAPTLALAAEDYLFFPEIPVWYRPLVWFAHREKKFCVMFLK